MSATSEDVTEYRSAIARLSEKLRDAATGDASCDALENLAIEVRRAARRYVAWVDSSTS